MWQNVKKFPNGGSEDASGGPLWSENDINFQISNRSCYEESVQKYLKVILLSNEPWKGVKKNQVSSHIYFAVQLEIFCLFVCFNRRWRLTWPSPMHHSSSFLPVTAVTMATCLKTTTALQHGLRWVENQVHVYAGLCLREIPWQPRILHRNTKCALKLQLEEVLN